MANVGSGIFLSWILTGMIVNSLSAETPRGRGQSCSSNGLSRMAPGYSKYLQNRVLGSINFARPDGRNWLIKQLNFRKRLMLWGFFKMDKNKNGLIEPSEAVAGRWSLRGSRACKLAFLQECDEDRSKSVSRKEWLHCFKVPACNKTCARGRLDPALCQCRCPQSVMQGRVVSPTGVPLQDAAILLGSSPYTELARTNKSGHFTMSESCESLSYTVTKNDYIPHRLQSARQPDAHPLLIRLEDAEPPYITVNPKSKTRIAGQSVNFTCEAEGTPPIKITWYHNGRHLQEESFENITNLFIPNVTGASQGFYTCKATNDYGSEISTPAELKIKNEKLDTCNRTPRSHIITLLPGCKVQSTGQNFLDVGQCSDEPCSQNVSFNQSCGGKEDCCCGPKGDEYQERISVECYGIYSTIDFYRVKECGCSTCLKQETILKGEVVGGPNQEPLKNITIIFKKKVVDRTNDDGQFSLVIPGDVDRLIVTFQDPTDSFFDTTQALPFQRGQTVFHRIALQEEDPPVTFDSTKEVRVPLGHSGDSMAELELPADNLLLQDGTPFKGKAKLRLSVTDPRNFSDVASAPGDFTTVNQSGSVQPLKTYGILRIKIQDENNERLDLAGNIKLRLDADKIVLPRNSSGEMAPLLWWLDEKTGRWRQLGEMKPTSTSRTKRASGGRRFYIGDIQTDKISVINIDIPWKRCYVRAQVYKRTGKDMEPSQGAVVTMIGRESTEQEQYYGYTQKMTDKNGIACIPAWCDSNVFLQSSKRSFNFANGSTSVIQLNPNKSSLDKLSPDLDASIAYGKESSSFVFTAKVTSQAGPVFGGDEMNKCLDPDDSLVAFKFLFEETENKPTDIDDFGSRPPGHPLSWYTATASKPNQETKKCFIKIAIALDRDLPQPMVSVQSFKSFTPDRQVRYGFSIKRPTIVAEKTVPWDNLRYFSVSSACVEYRCSEKDQETIIFVTILADRCFYLEPSSYKLKLETQIYAELPGEEPMGFDQTIGFSVPFDVSDGSLGLYSGPGKIAEERCIEGRVDTGEDGKIKPRWWRYAVSALDCYEEWLPFFSISNSSYYDAELP